MIEFHNQQALIAETVFLVAVAHPRKGCNLVVPPGFGSHVVARQLVACLRNHAASPALAFLEADAPSPNVHAHENLQGLLAALPEDRPVVAVFDRFHKILHTLDYWALAKLRSAEEENNPRLANVTLTPLDYAELKKRWSKDHPLTVSDFGKTHKRLMAQLGSKETLVQCCRELGLPDHLIRFALDVTGGYPEPLTELIKEWHRQERTAELSPDRKHAYAEVAERAVERLIDWLDLSQDVPTYRNAVIDLYHEVEVEKAADRLVGHPYEPLLIVSATSQLRAECVGAVAVRAAARGNADRFVAIRRLYERKQFAAARALLNEIPITQHKLSHNALAVHTRVMATLYHEDGENAGLDVEWKELSKTITAARERLEPFRPHIPEFARLEELYTELENLARTVMVAIGKAAKQNRLVDNLAGLKSHSTGSQQRRMAFLLMVRQTEVARAMAGASNAVPSALALPEQIFRVWAFCQLGLDFYCAPADQEETWALAEKEWRGKGDPLKRAIAGQPFPSFPAFAYFALAYQQSQLPAKIKGTALEPSFTALEANLQRWNSIRTDPAHAVVLTFANERKRYFELIDEWLNRALAGCCPEETRQGLLSICDPLPLIREDGGLEWVGI